MRVGWGAQLFYLFVLLGCCFLFSFFAVVCCCFSQIFRYSLSFLSVCLYSFFKKNTSQLVVADLVLLVEID